MSRLRSLVLAAAATAPRILVPDPGQKYDF